MSEFALEGHDEQHAHPAGGSHGPGPSTPKASLELPRQETLVLHSEDPSLTSELGQDSGAAQIQPSRPSAKDQDSRLSLPISSTSSRQQHLNDDPFRAESKGSRLSQISHHSIMHVAHDFLHRHKVDPLAFTVMFFGAMLAACAGMTNAVAFRALGAFVSHVTGTLSKVGLHAQASAFSDAGESLLLVFSFAIGSAICGCMISRNTVSFGNELYGLALLGNASLLFLAILTAEHEVAPYLLAAACGLQNGMATSYSGAVIRTTHVTGLCTDVGLIIGRNSRAFLRKHCCPAGTAEDTEDHTADCRKLFLLLLLGTGFLLGVFVGAALHAAVGVAALLVPACLTGTSGAAYTTYRTCRLHQPLMHGTESQASKDEEAQMEAQAPWVRTSDRKDSAASSRHSTIDVHGVQLPALKPLAGHEPLKLEDVNTPVHCNTALSGRLSSETVVPWAPPPVDTPRTPAEGVPMDRLLAIVDSLEPSLARIMPGSVPGQSDLQAEALEAHRRLRSVVSELTSQDVLSGCNV